jgi:1-phosphatidylinositol-3-phosphate 5-kinase
VLIVSFAIEYTRHQSHFMSLEPVIAQEREYLSNLVKRIAVLQPTVLLVEKHVAGLALSFLEERGIAVITNVKASVLHAVSRCTQTKVISSVDQLALDPSELGRCANFDVKTYVHGVLKKTYVYFTGCQKDLGCTIILRGAEMENLRKLKRITEFMCFVVYNLKLETCVMRDEYVLIPANIAGGTLASDTTDPSAPSSATTSQNLTTSESTASQNQDQNSEVTSPTVPSRTSTIAVSTVAASSVTKVSSEGYQYDRTSASPSFYDVVEEHKTKIISSSPFVKFMQPYLLTRAREQEAKLGELKRLRDQYLLQQNEETDPEKPAQFELVKPEMVHQLVDKPSKQVREFLFAVHDAEYEAALHSYQTQRRQWEAYLANNPTMFDPLNHQRIAVLYSMVNSKTNPCVGPEIIALGFYNEHDLDEDFLPDITLGQYVEDLCQSGDTICQASDCDDTMFKHHRQYVHGEGQMSVTVQQYPPRIRGMQKTILMWSVCRICGRETQVMPMSENTWKYSFGKYLELTFWSTELIPRAHACPHDIHRNHARYFGFNNVAVRIQYDAIQLYDILVPRTFITWKVDQDLRLKNEQFLRFKGKLDRFMGSVKSRIESIHVESMPADKIDDCRAEVDRLLALVKGDHDRLTKNLQDKYMNSRWYEIIPLNRAAKAIHENSIQWDRMFSEFEKNFYPSEKDIGLMTALQIKKLVESATSIASDDATDEPPEVDEKAKGKTLDATATPGMSRRLSIMSPEATKDVLASVIREQLSEGDAATDPATKNPNDQTTESVEESAIISGPSSEVASPVDSKNEQSSTTSGLSSSTTSIEKDIESSREALRTAEKKAPEDSQSLSSPAEATPQESKIPRPKDPARRSGAMPPRAHAHHSPGFSRSGTDGTDPATLPLSKTEKLKNLIAEPARALERRMAERMASRAGKQPPSMIPRSVPSKRHVFNLARHYEQLTREWENQRQRERQLRESRGAYPLALSKPVVEVYRDAQEAVKEVEPAEEVEKSPTKQVSVESPADGRRIAEAVATVAEEPSKKDQADNKSLASQVSAPEPSISEDAGVEDEAGEGPSSSAHGTETTQASINDSQLDLTELQKQEKSSLFRMLTNFWGERSSSGWSQLDYPFAANEHVWGDADIVVREDEPSSIIALALSSADYLAKLKSFRKEPENPTAEDIDASIESNLLHSKNTNIRYAFQNRGVKAQCKIFYAESFDALRRKCGASERIVESLSRCIEWDSKGGKTKSLFLKTLDDRFVLKSLSPVEVNSFFKFAPDYFAFVHAMLFNGLPSVMAKMFGLFQVTIRNPSSGTEFNWFMLVMENLFYDRSTNRRFDLKGSMRNRKIESTGERDEVLLDENLVDIIFEKPIFAREHTLKLLKASVWNDTLFLSKQNVMDYSLMAGFEDEAREIVVGVIDCIRTYTWDKKLETWIKDRGKNKPTVTSPKDYRNRFRVAMSKYMLLAPNCWHQFQAQQIQGRPVRLVGRKEESEGRVERQDVAGLALQ